MGGLDFDSAWERRVVSRYGGSQANWIDLDSLIEIKRAIDDPKHREDARVLIEVRKLRQRRKD